ncbi:AIG2 (avirulence induced gene) family protein [Trifolium repens]|nr:AIG2 (avirulence induced gene) family protein [Trifolium repens]
MVSCILRSENKTPVTQNRSLIRFEESVYRRKMSVAVNSVVGVGGVSTQNQNHNVFVYGSLLADEVVRALLNRVPPSSPATLSDYHRFKIKDRVYPAILPVQSKKVTGRVLLGISGVELDILDEFEDVEYTRTEVDVLFTEKSENLRAYAYVWSNPNDPDLYAEWDFEEWKKVHMDDFVKMTGSFMEQLELPESKPRVQAYETFYKQENDKPLDP